MGEQYFKLRCINTTHAAQLFSSHTHMSMTADSAECAVTNNLQPQAHLCVVMKGQVMCCLEMTMSKVHVQAK